MGVYKAAMAGIVAAFVSFTLFVLTHWAVCHKLRWRPLSKVLNGLWVAFLPIHAALFFFLGVRFKVFAFDLRAWSGVVNLLNGFLIQAFLLIGYTAFFFLIERGLSLRVMIEISRAPQRQMTIEDIKRIYPYDYILEKRLGQILQMGYWVKNGDCFYSTDKGRGFAAAHKLVWRIFRIGKD